MIDLASLPWSLWQAIRGGRASATVDADGHGDFSSIQAAVEFVEARGGGTVFIRAGTYYEAVSVTENYVHIIGEGWNTIIDGNGIASGQYQVTFTSVVGCSISNLKIQGTAGQSANYGNLNSATSDDILFFRVWSKDSDDTAMLIGGGATVIACRVDNPDGAGIQTGAVDVANGDVPIVIACHVDGAATAGLGFNADTSDYSIGVANVMTNNNKGIAIGGSDAYCLVVGNLCTLNSTEIENLGTGTVNANNQSV